MERNYWTTVYRRRISRRRALQAAGLKIKSIEDALGRLHDGSYGICDSCGIEIAEERLEALPFTRLCRDCQQDQEREAKAQRRMEDERSSYRKLGSTEADEEST